MSIALLFDLQKELRRLSIAGSDLAVGDFALKRILPGIKKTGETVAVFGKISGCLEKLLNSEGDTSSENLIDLSTIVNAVLYTQCQSDISGEITDIETTVISGKTTIPFRRIQPIIEALTSKGPGRFEIIKKAYEDGVFKDIRLILPAITALGDSYADIADFVQNKVLLDYGQDIVPILAKDIDLDGGKLHSRRLEVICKISVEDYRDLYLKALDMGSVEVKIAAINALKNFADSEEILLNQCNDKKKEVREAAYLALAEKESLIAAKALIKAFNGKDTEIVLKPIKINTSDIMSELLVLESKSILDSLNIEKPQEKNISKFIKLLECMEYRTNSNIFEFLKDALLSSKVLFSLKVNSSVRRYNYQLEYLSQDVASTIRTLKTKNSLEFLDSTRELENNQFMDICFEAALKSKSAEYVFDNYSDFLKYGKSSNAGKQILEVIKNNAYFTEEFPDLDSNFFSSLYGRYNLSEKNIYTVWDKRWLKLLIDLDEEELVFKFAQEDDNNCIAYILNKLNNHNGICKSREINLLLGLAQAKYSELDTVILYALKNTNAKSINYGNIYTFKILKLLSHQYAKDIEEFATNIISEYYKNDLMSIAEYVKNKK